MLLVFFWTYFQQHWLIYEYKPSILWQFWDSLKSQISTNENSTRGVATAALWPWFRIQSTSRHRGEYFISLFKSLIIFGLWLGHPAEYIKSHEDVNIIDACREWMVSPLLDTEDESSKVAEQMDHNCPPLPSSDCPVSAQDGTDPPNFRPFMIRAQLPHWTVTQLTVQCVISWLYNVTFQYSGICIKPYPWLKILLILSGTFLAITI